jgi:hypothetical protein
MLSLSNLLTAMVALSVATERVTEFTKNLPGFGGLLSRPRDQGTWQERLRVISVHALAFVVATLLCNAFPQVMQGMLGSGSGHLGWSDCALYGLLASGGSGFWNSALDTFRNVKKSLTPQQSGGATGGG